MKRYFIQFLFFICCTPFLAAQSQLTVNLNDTGTDSYLLQDINKITIVSNVVSVESVSISEENIELKNGETYQVEYSITPSNATNKSVSWASSNNNVATIDGNGLITTVSSGSTEIIIETEDGKLQDKLNVIVSPITSVEISNDDIKIYPNPIQNTLFIDMGSVTQYEVVISDISGNVLFSQYDQNQIDFRNFPTGSYFLTLIVNNKYYNFNLIKN